VWEALIGAGPTVSVAATREDVDHYLGVLEEFVGELAAREECTDTAIVDTLPCRIPATHLRRGPGHLPPRGPLALIHRSAWKGNSANFACRILNNLRR
jgi:hypothetical protein